MLGLRVFIMASVEVPTVMTRSVTTVDRKLSVAVPLHHHYLSSLGKLGPYLSSLQQLFNINTCLCPAPVYSFSSSLPPLLSLSSLSLFFFQPKRGDMAINLRVANELHLTIKCTGNGTFHLQEDQWQ